ncbi:MAG: hypothetical protein PVJ89_02230 [Planctomycetota bacterium]|jgi:anti-sigma factor RsiW
MRRDSDGNDRRPGEGQAIGSREEFESALPLFVGGDLEASDERAVREWLVHHPEDQELLVAAERARDVLKEHVRGVREAEVPDLWPGVRVALDRAGALPARPEPVRALAAGRGWSRGLAAAAALLLATGIGLLMSEPPAAPEAPQGLVAETEGFGGAEAEVRLVGSERRGTPLRRPEPGESHLIDEAPLVPLWQQVELVPVSVQPAGSQLASDRR